MLNIVAYLAVAVGQAHTIQSLPVTGLSSESSNSAEYGVANLKPSSSDGFHSGRRHGDDDASAVSADSFNDVAAVWGEVMALKTELDDIIASKKLLDVHKAAFAIRNHVNLLP